MTGKVIQGSFLGGQPKLPPPVPARLPPPSPPVQAKPAMRLRGPPAPAFAARPPGPPIPAFAGRAGMVQRHGAGGAFAIEGGPLGLASGGGRSLPDGLRGKMEAALGANFADVRIYVGPQAERIGAIAFTVGSDIYFAPGRFQPDTVPGQQLLGHELAHVVQQRAGRVRNPLGSGLAVVQDHALEAEADRLGQRAAMHRVTAQAKMPTGAAQHSASVRISPPISTGPGSCRRVSSRLRALPQPRALSAVVPPPTRFGAAMAGGTASSLQPQTRGAVAPPPTRFGALPVQRQSRVVQRDIGFEFETQWTVKAPGGLLGSDTDIVRGTGWKMRPDMKPLPPEMLTGPFNWLTMKHDNPRYTGYGSVEFITDPFPETSAGRFNLNFTMNQLERVVTDTGNLWKGVTGWGEVPVTDMANGPVIWSAWMQGKTAQERNDIWIDRHGAQASATPQMTAGIRLVRVSRLLKQMGTAPLGGAPNLLARSQNPAPMRNRIAQIRQRAHTQAGNRIGHTAAENKEYEGALSHLGLIVCLAGIMPSVEQEKYLSPLLSRTDFGLLPAQVRNDPNFAQDVMLASGRNNGGGWAATLGDALFIDANRGTRTIGQWLTAVANGADPMTWGQDRTLANWQPQQVGPMGHQSTGHVYEFRALEGSIPVGEWCDWAVARFDYIMNTING